jgi:hypothetical protein
MTALRKIGRADAFARGNGYITTDADGVSALSI